MQGSVWRLCYVDLCDLLTGHNQVYLVGLHVQRMPLMESTVLPLT
jgi:hypothetical protein